MKRVLAAVAMGAALGACTPDFVTQDQSEVILRIEQLSGVSAGDADSGDNALNSDVSPAFDDIATVTLRVIPKNPGVTDPGAFQDIRIERYEVRYVRSDGRAVEGVDVPFRISGNISATVPYGSSADIVFDVVRHQAKFEPPLLNLVGSPTQLDPTGGPVFGGGALILTCFADITLHGRSVTGAAVTANGRMQINFADFVSS